MTDTKLLTEFMEKYGNRLNDEEKTLGDEIFMWLVYKLEEAQLQAFEVGKKAERERLMEIIGEDEPFDTLDDTDKKYTAQDMELIAVRMRNKLRAEQRKKLSALTKE